MNYLRAQVNFLQLRAETAGNRYLRRFLPASAGIFTCGSVYLRPSQVILHAPVLQCSSPQLCHTVSCVYRTVTGSIGMNSSFFLHYTNLYDYLRKTKYTFLVQEDVQHNSETFINEETSMNSLPHIVSSMT